MARRLAINSRRLASTTNSQAGETLLTSEETKDEQNSDPRSKYERGARNSKSRTSNSERFFRHRAARLSGRDDSLRSQKSGRGSSDHFFHPSGGRGGSLHAQ